VPVAEQTSGQTSSETLGQAPQYKSAKEVVAFAVVDAVAADHGCGDC